ncbi:MAG: glycogen/starch synthase, partial [Alistipes sp.]|nr:glycogen/starch synthase [Alistipes sp.]
MRVLMFGWEFPPHIAGGLGTACYGLTRGLTKHDVQVIFVVPRAYGDEDQRFVHVVNASDVECTNCTAPRHSSTQSSTSQNCTTEEDALWEKLTFIHIDSNMVPYVSPEEFDEYARKAREQDSNEA